MGNYIGGTDAKECDCPYKERCPETRQHLQSYYRERDGSTIQDCWAYKLLEEQGGNHK